MINTIYLEVEVGATVERTAEILSDVMTAVLEIDEVVSVAGVIGDDEGTAEEESILD